MARRSRGGADSGSTGPSRRQFLLGGAVAGTGAAAAIGADALLRRGDGAPETAAPAPATDGVNLHGDATEPFFGDHQAGITTAAQAHASFIGLDLREEVDADGLGRLMRVLSDDASRLTQGVPALADSEPELALVPARLTVTFGFGPELLNRAGVEGPTWLRPLPAFGIDRLQPEFSDGDLLLQICAEDPSTVAHAARMLSKSARSFTTVRWVQHGFRRAYGSQRPGTTMRNLFGQVDGTTNLEPDTPDFDRLVWVGDGRFRGSTSVVLRRIHLDLEGWDDLDRPGREQSIGRTLSNGAPLTGVEEFDEPDFEALTPIGFPVIPEFSHIQRSRPEQPDELIFRRGYNYDDAPGSGQISDSGMVFVSYQADVDRQFVPIQRRLDELDLLNEWTTPIGSSVFLIPPGCTDAPGDYIGRSILEP